MPLKISVPDGKNTSGPFCVYISSTGAIQRRAWSTWWGATTWAPTGLPPSSFTPWRDARSPSLPPPKPREPWHQLRLYMITVRTRVPTELPAKLWLIKQNSDVRGKETKCRLHRMLPNACKVPFSFFLDGGGQLLVSGEVSDSSRIRFLLFC
jgi:hypothetical protein